MSTRRIFMSHGMGVILPRPEADKLLEHLFDEVDCWWEAKRIDDSGYGIETERFRTLRTAIMWILKYPETLQFSDVPLRDATVLAMELNLLYGTGISIDEFVIPDIWVATQTMYATPQWCM